MSYLVDSDWLIDTLRGVPTAVEVPDKQGVHGLSISSITLGEVYEGVFHRPDAAKRLSELQDVIEEYAILGLTDPIMQVFARTRSMPRRSGRLIPDMDLLTGSMAIVHELTLMTRNLRHFQRIPELRLYVGEDDA